MKILITLALLGLASLATAQSLEPIVLSTPILSVTITGTSDTGVFINAIIEGTGFVVTDFMLSPSGNLIALMSDQEDPIEGHSLRYAAAAIPSTGSGLSQTPILLVYTKD